MTKLTSYAVLSLLAAKHSKDVFVPECKSGPTQWGNHDRLDAWVMPRSWAHPAVTGYEIKVSRSDFMRDEKWQNYLPMCNFLYFVAPKGLIDPGELPQEVGLMEVTTGGRRLITRRKAVKRDVSIPEDVWRYILMCRAAIRGETQDSVGRAEYWRMWLEKRAEDQELGGFVSKRILALYDENVTKVQAENNALRSRIAGLERVEKVLADLGITEVGRYGAEGQVRQALAQKRGDLSQRMVHRLNECERAIRELRSVTEEEIVR